MSTRVDNYCWLCHGMAGMEGTLICAWCPRSFHADCMKPEHSFSGLLCPECIKVNSAKAVEANVLQHYDLTQLLCLMLESIAYKWKDFENWPCVSENDNSKLCRIVDLNVLRDRINMASSYETVAAFLSDVKWINHNMHIVYGPKHAFTTRTRQMENSIRTNIADLLACPHCYIALNICRHPRIKEYWKSSMRKNNLKRCSFYAKHAFTVDSVNFHDSFVEQLSSEYCLRCFGALPAIESELFTNPCPNTHKLVWAKLKGYPYYPAKVLEVIDNKAVVVFFGTHERSKVNLCDCFCMSRKYPCAKPPDRESYRFAFSELRMHIHKLEKKFGPYCYQGHRTPFGPPRIMYRSSVGKRTRPMERFSKRRRTINSRHHASGSEESSPLETSTSPDITSWDIDVVDSIPEPQNQDHLDNEEASSANASIEYSGVQATDTVSKNESNHQALEDCRNSAGDQLPIKSEADNGSSVDVQPADFEEDPDIHFLCKIECGKHIPFWNQSVKLENSEGEIENASLQKDTSSASEYTMQFEGSLQKLVQTYEETLKEVENLKAENERLREEAAKREEECKAEIERLKKERDNYAAAASDLSKSFEENADELRKKLAVAQTEKEDLESQLEDQKHKLHLKDQIIQQARKELALKSEIARKMKTSVEEKLKNIFGSKNGNEPDDKTLPSD